MKRTSESILPIYWIKKEIIATFVTKITYTQSLIIKSANLIALAIIVTEFKVFIRTQKTSFVRYSRIFLLIGNRDTSFCLLHTFEVVRFHDNCDEDVHTYR